jgi:uncharacterized protein (TIGR00369 family)
LSGTPLKTARTCFGCGAENAGGLHVTPALDDDGRVRSPFTGRTEHRGYSTIVHGGLVAAVCDEMMGFAMVVYRSGQLYVTVSLEVRYHKPVIIDVPMVAEAWCTRRQGRFVHVRARILGPGEVEHATARGRFVQIPEKL